MKHNSFLSHLLHRRCERCWTEGHAAGYLAAASESKERERLIAAGLDPDDLEARHRAYLIEHEVADAA